MTDVPEAPTPPEAPPEDTGWYTAGVEGKVYRPAAKHLLLALFMFVALAFFAAMVALDPPTDAGKAALIRFFAHPNLVDASYVSSYAMLFLFLLLMGLGQISAHFNSRVVLSDDGLRIRNFLGREVFLPWECIAAISHSRLGDKPAKPFRLAVHVRAPGFRERQIVIGVAAQGETPALRELREEILRRREMQVGHPAVKTGPDAGEPASPQNQPPCA